MNIDFLGFVCQLDRLGVIMTALISYIGVCVLIFSSRYMSGDAKYCSFFLRIVLLVFSAAIMVTSGDLLVLIVSLCVSNLILVSLVTHKAKWKAAKVSGLIAAKNYLLSTIFMVSAFGLFYFTTGQTSIISIINQSHNHIIINIIFIIILFCE